jgi:AcrR family transcriptional regulator
MEHRIAMGSSDTHADGVTLIPQDKPAPTKPSTRERILDAALTILGRDGFHGLTTRAIADEVGINQALINYHFGTKDKLLLEISGALESGKYARQWTMYHEQDVPLSQKWREAVEYYRQDIADGYIRISQELYAIGYSNSGIAERMMERLNRWQALLEEVAAAYLPALGMHVPPAYVASALANFWLGMNLRIVGGDTANIDQFFEILDYVGDMLEARERQAADLVERGG